MLIRNCRPVQKLGVYVERHEKPGESRTARRLRVQRGELGGAASRLPLSRRKSTSQSVLALAPNVPQGPAPPALGLIVCVRRRINDHPDRMTVPIRLLDQTSWQGAGRPSLASFFRLKAPHTGRRPTPGRRKRRTGALRCRTASPTFLKDQKLSTAICQCALGPPVSGTANSGVRLAPQHQSASRPTSGAACFISKLAGSKGA